MDRPDLEALNSSLFETFDASEAASMVGAVGKITYSYAITGGVAGSDTSIDADWMP